MNETKPENPEKEDIVAKENKDNKTKRLSNRFVLGNQRVRSEKDDAENTESDVILDDTALNLPKNKKKIGSHCLAELHSFRSKFK